MGSSKRTGITASAFDLLHIGHVLMLKEAKTQCDYLIAALHVDPSLERADKNAPVQSLFERYMQLQSCKYVDEVIPYQTEQDLEDLLSILDVQVRIIGVEYKNTDFTGKEICAKRGIRTYFNSRDHKFSSSELRKRLYNESI